MPKRKRFDSDFGAQDTDGKKYYDRTASGVATPKPVLWRSNPEDTIVRFPENPLPNRSFDFAPWYDGRIDAVTRACQQVIQRMLQERKRAITSVALYCAQGLRSFLAFCRLWASALDRPMGLSDIDRELIENYIRDLKGQEIGYVSQKVRYHHAKAVITEIRNHGWIADDRLFPSNPFPNAKRKSKGEKPLSTAERHRVVTQLKADLALIQEGDAPLTSDELVVCMLGIAVRSGINPVPLVELPSDCIQPHPFKHDRKLLVSYKRRGSNTHIQPLRQTKDVTSIRSVMMDVEHIVDLVRRRNAAVREQSALYRDRLFVYVSRSRRNSGDVRVFGAHFLLSKLSQWVEQHGLLDDNGNPLTLNVMRLRKTFENRIWTLSGQDPIVTARLGGHSLKVSNDHYLEAPPEAEKQFRLMGEVLTNDLLSNPKVLALPAKNTPVSKCRDSLNGQFAPQTNGDHCTNFLACVRCRSFVVTEADLYRLFSFYWLLVHEREYIGARKWMRYFGHIIRIVDRDIAPRFSSEVVEAARQKAKESPHPFWRQRDQLEDAV